MSLTDDSIQSVFDLVHEMRTLLVRLDGTSSQPGVIVQTNELTKTVSAAVEKLTSLVERMSASSELHQQLKALPSQLLRPDLSKDFRDSVREVMACELSSAVELARERAEGVGVAIAISDLQELFFESLQKADSRVFGSEGSRVDLFYKLKNAESQVRRLKRESDVLSKELNRISGIHRAELKEQKDKNLGLVSAVQQSARKSLTAYLLIGLLFIGVLSYGYLAPLVEGFILPAPANTQSHQGRL